MMIGGRARSTSLEADGSQLVVGREKLSYSPQKEAHVGQLLAMVVFRVGSLIALVTRRLACTSWFLGCLSVT